MILHLRAGGEVLHWPQYDDGHHGSSCFHGMCCVLSVVYVRYGEGGGETNYSYSAQSTEEKSDSPSFFRL